MKVICKQHKVWRFISERLDWYIWSCLTESQITGASQGSSRQRFLFFLMSFLPQILNQMNWQHSFQMCKLCAQFPWLPWWFPTSTKNIFCFCHECALQSYNERTHIWNVQNQSINPQEKIGRGEKKNEAWTEIVWQSENGTGTYSNREGPLKYTPFPPHTKMQFHCTF